MIIQKAEEARGIIVYFGGDVQTLQCKMKQFADWSLENVVEKLAKNHPNWSVVAVQPDRMEQDTFACYDSFVKSDLNGSPIYQPDKYKDGKATLKLESRLKEIGAETQPKKIIGFSKGVVVLNQLVFEWKHSNSDFFKSIETLCWIDGGHNNPKDPVWITDNDTLQFLADSKVKIDIRCTPYQIQDRRRSWIGEQEAKFSHKLKQLLPDQRFRRKVFFLDEQPSLLNHFRALDTFELLPIL